MARVGIGDVLAAALGLLGIHVDHRNGNARVGEDHGDAGSHRAGADHGRLLDRLRLEIRGEARDFAEFAFGEEKVHRGLRGQARDQFSEDARFASDAVGVVEVRRGFDRVDQLVRRESAAVFGGNHAVRERDHGRRDLDLERADPVLRAGFLFAERDGPGDHVEIVELTQTIVDKAKNFDESGLDAKPLGFNHPNGKPMVETLRNYQTDDGSFTLRKVVAGRLLEPSEAKELLEKRMIGPLQGFRSKAGWPFSAVLKLNDANETEFVFDNAPVNADRFPLSLSTVNPAVHGISFPPR